jgi:TolB-like protein
LLAIGFPIALIISWAFDLTPDGLVRDLGDNPQFRGKGRRVEYVLIVLLAVAVGFLFMDNHVLDRAPASSAGSVSAKPPDSAAAVSGDRALEHSVAVLPFENGSPNPDDAYFATGLHEEVLIQLSKLSNLSVISRTSVLRYADSDLTIPEIARELNVGMVMEASVRYAGNRIRITAELIDAETDRNLWGETYDREFNDIFAIESDIAMNVANALEAEFSPDEQRALKQTPTSEPAAYAFYLRARNFLTGNLGTEAAHAALDRAIEIDSGFANAYALKALLYAASLVNTAQGTGVAAEERDALEGRVREFAQQALDLDPGNAIARDALRNIFIVTGRWSAFEQAVEPGDEVTFSPAALWTYAWMGKRDEAVRLGQRRAELDPNDVEAHLDLGVVYAYAGDYEASMRSFERRTPSRRRIRSCKRGRLTTELRSVRLTLQQRSCVCSSNCLATSGQSYFCRSSPTPTRGSGAATMARASSMRSSYSKAPMSSEPARGPSRTWRWVTRRARSRAHRTSRYRCRRENTARRCMQRRVRDHTP